MKTAYMLAQKMDFDPSKVIELAACLLEEVNHKDFATSLRLLADPFRDLPGLYSHEHTKDPILPLHFTREIEGVWWHWYPYEYDRLEGIIFGLVDGFEVELGYFSINDINSCDHDNEWTPLNLSQVRMNADIRRSLDA